MTVKKKNCPPFGNGIIVLPPAFKPVAKKRVTSNSKGSSRNFSQISGYRTSRSIDAKFLRNAKALDLFKALLALESLNS